LFERLSGCQFFKEYPATEGKREFIPVHFFFFTEHHAMKAYGGIGGIDPSILDISTRWR